VHHLHYLLSHYYLHQNENYKQPDGSSSCDVVDPDPDMVVLVADVGASVGLAVLFFLAFFAFLSLRLL
jgi:hypothetical protein